MENDQSVSKGLKWASYILQGIAAAMFLMGSVNNLLQTEMAVQGAVEMGYPESSVLF